MIFIITPIIPEKKRKNHYNYNGYLLEGKKDIDIESLSTDKWCRQIINALSN